MNFLLGAGVPHLVQQGCGALAGHRIVQSHAKNYKGKPSLSFLQLDFISIALYKVMQSIIKVNIHFLSFKWISSALYKAMQRIIKVNILFLSLKWTTLASYKTMQRVIRGKPSLS